MKLSVAKLKPRFPLLLMLAAAGCATVNKPGEIEEQVALLPVSHVLPVWKQWLPNAELAATAQQAVAQSNNLLASSARRRVAEANARIAGAARQLQASASLQASRAKRNVDTVGGNVPVTTNSYNLGIDLSWEIDIWNRLSLNQQAALSEFQAASADVRAAELSLIANVYRSGFNLAEATEQLQLNATNEDIISSNAEVIERNFAQGTAAALDVRLSRSNLANAESQRLQSAARLDSIRGDIQLLLSEQPTAEGALARRYR